MTTRVRDCIDLRPSGGVSQLHRNIFSDPDIFDREIKLLFEGGWVFLALETQLPEPDDFLVTRIGRHQILVMRDRSGAIGAFYNTCPHRGAQICASRQGNQRLHVCPYHSWSFDSAGANKAIKAKAAGAYADEFLHSQHDLHRIARLESYRGFIFGSLVADVDSLEAYLGDARHALDLSIDAGGGILEVLPGAVTYTYRANWKFQLENSADGYHVTSTHPTFMRIAEDRAREQADKAGLSGLWDRAGALLEDNAGQSRGGSFAFANGHVLAWSSSPAIPSHPLFARRDELVASFGATSANWMFYLRNLTIFPNVQIADNFASTLRIIRPIAPDLTEMVSYCLAPKGEEAEARQRRLRQFEDFFNPSGLATPDDLVVFESCQDGSRIAGEAGWLQGYARGMRARADGANGAARELNIEPRYSVEGSGVLNDETVFQNYYETIAERLDGAAEEAPRGMVKA